MNDFDRKRRVEFLVRLLLPGAAVLAFCARFLPYTSPGANNLRPYFNTTLLDHVASVVLIGVLLLSAVGLGAFVLRKMRAAGGVICAAALGMGAISMAVLALGSLGLMGYAFPALLVVPPLLFAPDISLKLQEMRRRAQSFIASRSPALDIIVIAAAFVLLLNIVRAFIPPLDYDVLEYHLGAPAQYLRDGRIHFLQRNVYAAMPSNIEMLYLLGLGLKGDLIHGAAQAKLINVALGLLAAASAGLLARKLSGSRLAGALAAAAFFVFPWSSYLSTRAYVEPGMIMFALAALCAFFDHFSLGDRRSAALAGVFAGLAGGCKYPAILFLMAPMAVAFFAAHAARRKWREACVRCAVFGAAAVIVLSPWLIKNAVATGNPTYPLLHNMFGGTNWSPEQDAKWASAHRPNGFGPRALKRSALSFLNKPDRTGGWYLWIPIAAGIALTSRKRKGQWVLLAYVLACFMLWYFFTHRIARFLAPWAMIAIVPAACAAARTVAWRRGAAYGAAVLTVVMWSWSSLQDRSPREELPFAFGLFDEHAALEQLTQQATFNYGSIAEVNRLPRGSRVLMIGEAETFYCTADVVAATVFDRNPLVTISNSAGSAQEVREALRADGITHVYVNLPEAKRLRDTYRFEYEGQERPGYWDLTPNGRQVFASFMKDHCEPQATFGGPMPLRRLKNARDRDLFRAFTGGRVVPCGNGLLCLPWQYAIYRLK